ncbi:MAG: DUF366 family protein [Bdellovibrionaceae bacterium]|nr:DUF366 family protein [Pseudobdellovibrionaceae bacterium]NUM58442.1 DUF366 family protein [Pseudobdellovibrionaceae bacterium]
MKTKWISKNLTYDGTQLRPLFAYENFKISGNSIVSWVGPCDISFENMKDLEDVVAGSAIRGSKMLHFIIEVFHQNIFSGVCLQRLFASIVKDIVNQELSLIKKKILLYRSGDDLYFQDRKLSISIATQGVLATQIHFAVNVSNVGTPVKTLSLEDLKLNPKDIATKVMKVFSKEVDSIQFATVKVRTL